MYTLLPFYLGHQAKLAQEYENRVETFKETTAIDDLCDKLACYIPQAFNDMNIHVLIIVRRAWGRQKLWFVEELIKVIFGLHKDECQWFRVTSGSVILDFLVPQSLIMPTIVRCVSQDGVHATDRCY